MEHVKDLWSGNLWLKAFIVLMWLWPLFCMFEKGINTKNPVRLVGYFAWSIGALVWQGGTFNFIMIFGVLVVIATYYNEIYDRIEAQGKINKRRNDPDK